MPKPSRETEKPATVTSRAAEQTEGCSKTGRRHLSPSLVVTGVTAPPEHNKDVSMEIPSVTDQKDVHDIFDSPTDICGFPHYDANANLGAAVAFINWLLPRHWGVWDEEKIQTDPIKFYHTYHKSKREGKLLRNRLADKLHLKNYELSRSTFWEIYCPTSTVKIYD